MSEEIKDLSARLEEQLQRAYAEDSLPPGLDDPAWLPTAKEREHAERAEAEELLRDWLKLDHPPAVLLTTDATDTVLGTCGASRGYLERLLTDAEYSRPSLLIKDDTDGPCACLTVPRQSRLARASGFHVEDTVEVKVSAASFANHVAMRVNVTETDAGWLWRAVNASILKRAPFAALFSSLSFSKVGARDLKVEFSSAN